LEKLRVKSRFEVGVDTPVTGEGTPFIDKSIDFGSTAPIKSWFWQFGDGSMSTDSSPVHVYQNAGEFPVSLKVTAHDGDTDISSQTITVFESDDGGGGGSGCLVESSPLPKTINDRLRNLRDMVLRTPVGRWFTVNYYNMNGFHGINRKSNSNSI
jgi:hypothetical protein